MRVILVNGPKRSGKDTFAKMLSGNVPFSKIMWFAKPMKEAAHRLFGFDVPFDYFEQVKDLPQPYLNGKSWRQIYISMSEDYAKPYFGIQHFGLLALREARRLPAETDTVIFADSGFAPEGEAMTEPFPGKRFLIRMHRQGNDFTGDSRSYIDVPGCKTYDVYNDSSLENLYARASNLIREITRESNGESNL